MTKDRRWQVPALAGAAATLLLGVAACGGSPEATGPAATSATVVVTSTNVWASVVKAVGGDHVEVRPILIDAAADPHGYESKPADAVAFDEAKLAVSNGGGYDDFFTGLADSAGGDVKRIVAVEVAEGHGGEAEASAAPADEHAEEGHDHAHGENEHVWYDFEAVHAVAERVAADLSAVDPANKAAFEANVTAFGEGLDALIAKAEAIGAAKPGAKVVATEPVAAYLLETAGLTDATPAEFAEAVEEESEPPAAARAATEELITDGQVVALLFNEQTATPVTEAVKATAERAGVPVVGVSETLPAEATSYLEWMTTQVDGLAAAVAK